VLALDVSMESSEEGSSRQSNRIASCSRREVGRSSPFAPPEADSSFAPGRGERDARSFPASAFFSAVVALGSKVWSEEAQREQRTAEMVSFRVARASVLSFSSWMSRVSCRFQRAPGWYKKNDDRRGLPSKTAL